jgi:hypothetical protein
MGLKDEESHVVAQDGTITHFVKDLLTQGKLDRFFEMVANLVQLNAFGPIVKSSSNPYIRSIGMRP